MLNLKDRWVSKREISMNCFWHFNRRHLMMISLSSKVCMIFTVIKILYFIGLMFRASKQIDSNRDSGRGGNQLAVLQVKWPWIQWIILFLLKKLRPPLSESINWWLSSDSNWSSTSCSEFIEWLVLRTKCYQLFVKLFKSKVLN